MSLMIPKPLNRESIYGWRDYSDQFSWDHEGIVRLEKRGPWMETGGGWKEATHAVFKELEQWTESLSKQQSRTVHWLAFPDVLVSSATLLVFLQGTAGMEWRDLERSWQYAGSEWREAKLFQYYATLGFMCSWAKYTYMSFEHGRTSKDISEAERLKE